MTLLSWQRAVERLPKAAFRTSLEKMQKLIVMSTELGEALDALFMARVPPSWVKVSELAAATLGVWFANIVQRGEQLTAWLTHSPYMAGTRRSSTTGCALSCWPEVVSCDVDGG